MQSTATSGQLASPGTHSRLADSEAFNLTAKIGCRRPRRPAVPPAGSVEPGAGASIMCRREGTKTCDVRCHVPRDLRAFSIFSEWRPVQQSGQDRVEPHNHVTFMELLRHVEAGKAVLT